MTNQQSLPSSLKRRIIEKIYNNKLTIIVGPTGCGKSSIVPQVLLDNIGGPILTTQPRRLAVVAISSYVAQQRGTLLGTEVGYHVGQDRKMMVSSSSSSSTSTTSNNQKTQTQLVFSTAGVLLEELKGNGIKALTKYKVVIIDECHERSCESDLVLAIIREFMMTTHPTRSNNLRLVLMSATFNHDMYSSYFRNVPGCEYVDTIPIYQSVRSMDAAFYDMVQTYYLEDVARMLGRRLTSSSSSAACDDDDVAIRKEEYVDYCNDMKCDPWEELSSVDDGKALSSGLLMCIRALVVHLHKEEEEDAIFLVFAPTYRHLEQIFNILDDYNFNLGVLHSTIDIEDCLKSMQASQSQRTYGRKNNGTTSKRKILLASAIADSSVTIPNVACVIDTCRALEVKWIPKRSRTNAATVYASQAICDQRKGRTGRTCKGKVYRLVYQSFYNNSMEKWEQPKLSLASCRNEVLSLLSSENKVMSDPQILLRKCLDPPNPSTVTEAAQYLKDVGACREVIVSRKRKLVLTDHGALMSVLPFTVEEAGDVIHGGKHGFLHEALALVAIKSARPQPIVNAFGDSESNRLNLSRYFPYVDPKDQKSAAIAHLAAYVFWYMNWNKIRRHQMKEHFKNCTGRSDGGVSSHFFGDYSSTNDDKFGFNVGSWTPEMDQAHSDWCREHFINPSSVKSITQYIDVALKTLYHSNYEPEWLKCQALEPVWNSDRHIEMQHDVFSSLYGAIRGKELTMKTLVQLQGRALSQGRVAKSVEYACIHFLNGNCRFGDECMNVHSFSAPAPPCRFHLRGGCTNDDCKYAHIDEPANISSEEMIAPTNGKFHGGALAWFVENSGLMLLLGSCDFCHSLEAMGTPPTFFISRVENGSIFDVAHFHKNSNLLLHRNLKAQILKCAWTFPSASNEATDEENESLLRGFFMSAAAYFQSKVRTMSHVEVGLALQVNQFSKWNVMQISQHAGFCLEWYEDFDCAMFPNYISRYANNEEMKFQDATFYVFRLKRNVLYNPTPKMMEIRQGTRFGIELEMTSAGHWTRGHIANELSRSGVYVENIEENWNEIKRIHDNWKLVHDGSIKCNISDPKCNQFELVSPILQSEDGLRSASRVLQSMSNVKVTLNKSMGFHVHFDVDKYYLSDLIKICQNFIKYENAIDSMLPKSRRTGSTESSNYFKSNTKLAKEMLGTHAEGVLNSLALCKTTCELASIMNPSVGIRPDRYYKLNLQNLVTKRQPTIEFRQHSSTANFKKVEAWVRFCVRFCENSVSLEKPASFTNQPHSLDEQFDDLFTCVIRDSVLHSYYRERKHLLSADEEGDNCCHDCVTGQGCSK